MLFYLPLVAAVPILYLAFYRNEHRDRIILSSVCIIMFLLLALRKPFSDIKTYQVMYEELRGVPFGDIIRDFHLVKACAISGCEWGYSFICWVFSNIGLHFQFFLVFESAFCVFCVYRFIDRNSLNIPLSISLIVMLGAFDYMYIVIRQSIALGFLLLSVESVKKRNLPVFLILVLCAVMIHRTSALFILVYPLSYLSITRIKVAVFSCVSLLLIPVCPLLEGFFMKVMTLLDKTAYMEGFAFEFNELILVILAIIVFLMVFFDQKRSDEVKNRVVFWAFMISLPLHAVSCYVAILGRLSTLTFLPFASIAIPNLLETNENKKMVKVLEILIFASAVAYYAICLFLDKRELELIPYRFFFN